MANTLSKKRSSDARSQTGEIEACFRRFRESNDREALAQCLRIVEPELRNVARYYTLSPEEAEDCVQSTVVTMIERADAFDLERRLMPWLIGILLKKVAMSRRKTLRLTNEFEPELGREPSPLFALESSEVGRMVDEALEQLPPTYRDVLVLHLRQGKGGREIASELHRPQGTIRAQIHRGLRLLRRSLPPSLALGGLWAVFTRPAHALGRGAGKLATARVRLSSTTSIPAALPLLVAVGLTAGIFWLGRREVRAETAALTLAVDGARDSDGLAFDAPDGGPLVPSAGADARRESVTSVAGPTATPPNASELRFFAFARGDRHPLEASSLEIDLRLRTGEAFRTTVRTDASGRVAIPVQASTLDTLRVLARSEGYAPAAFLWDRGLQTLDADGELLLPIHRARPIGGVVVDQAGLPIAGAQIHLAVWDLANDEVWRVAPEELVTLTNSEGRWRHDLAPEPTGRLKWRVSHPDHAISLRYGTKTLSPADFEALWNLRLRTVLTPAPHAHRLRVRAAGGGPLAGASIALFERRDPPRNVTTFRTGANGELSLRLESDEPLFIRVEADGHAPLLKPLVAGRDTDLELTLARAERRTLTLIDELGLPVSGALLRPAGRLWKDAVESDAEGRLDLELSVRDPLHAELRLGNALGALPLSIRPADTVVRVPSVRTLTGSVHVPRDAEDSRIELRVIDDESGRTLARRHWNAGAPFEFRIFSASGVIRVGAQGEGLAQSESEPLRASAFGWTWETSLAPERRLEGRILANGVPVDYGEIGVLRPDTGPTLSNGTLLEVEKVRLSGDGRFALSRPEEPFALAINSRDGFALVPSQELGGDNTIAVVPWGELRGTVPPRADGAPQTLALSLDQLLRQADGLHFGSRYETEADPIGRFHFRAVPAGEVTVYVVDTPERRTSVHVSPGKVTEAELP